MSGGISGLSNLRTLGTVTSAVGKIGEIYTTATGAYTRGRAYQAAAKAELRKAAYEEEKHRKEVKYLLGKQKLLYAKAGVDPGAGSPLAVLAYTAAEGEKEAWMIREKGEIAAGERRAAAREEKGRGMGAVFGGVTSFLTGMEKYYARRE